MKIKKIAVFATAFSVTAFAFAAAAPSQKTTTMAVSVVVKAECTVRSPEVDMGSGSLLLTSAMGVANIAVACTNTVPYQIGLDAGDVAGSTTGNRYMAGLNPAHKIAYSIYKEGTTQQWGNTPGVDTVAGTGTGVETFSKATVFLDKQNVAPDTYSSNVTVSISF